LRDALVINDERQVVEGFEGLPKGVGFAAGNIVVAVVVGLLRWQRRQTRPDVDRPRLQAVMRLGPDLPKLVGLDRAYNRARGGGNDDRRALVLDPVSLDPFGVIRRASQTLKLPSLPKQSPLHFARFGGVPALRNSDTNFSSVRTVGGRGVSSFHRVLISTATSPSEAPGSCE